MRKDCGFYTAKYTLGFSHFIIFVVSAVVLAIGVWLSVDKTSLIALMKMTDLEYLDDLKKAIVIDQLGYALNGFGSVLLVVSFFGCFGAIRESRSMIATYAILTGLLICTEIGAIGLGFIYQDACRNITKNFLRESLLTYSSSNDQKDIFSVVWNKFMSALNCCGVDNYIDLDISEGWLERKGNRTIPEACCILKNINDLIPRDDDCVTSPNDNNSYYSVGCYEMLINWLINHRSMIFGIIIGINIGLCVCIILSFLIWNSIRRIQRLRL